MGTFGGFEWVIIIVVLLLFFGARKIPDMARGIGQGIREFRNATEEGKRELEKEQNQKEK